MAGKNDTTPVDTDLAGYDHSQQSGPEKAEDEEPAASDTYVDKDHDGGWSNQVAMDDFKDRSGGEAYARMSRGVLDDTYGRGPEGLGADTPPKGKD